MTSDPLALFPVTRRVWSIDELCEALDAYKRHRDRPYPLEAEKEEIEYGSALYPFLEGEPK